MAVEDLIYCAKSKRQRPGETSQQLRALVPAEDLGSLPSTHIVSHNHL